MLACIAHICPDVLGGGGICSCKLLVHGHHLHLALSIPILSCIPKITLGKAFELLREELLDAGAAPRFLPKTHPGA